MLMRGILFLILFSNLSLGQGLDFIDLDALSLNNQVVVIWRVNAGSYCQNIEIQHSTDGVNFQTYDVYSGICGDPEIETTYENTHQEPVIGVRNYYRLKVNQSYTKTVDIFIPKKEEILIVPHPITNSGEIIIAAEFKNAQLKVFSLSGELVFQRTISDKSPIFISKDDIKSGTYILHLSNTSKAISERLIVQ